jgi:acetyl-CoA carboxylase biotin carboxylase subunit
MQRRHQKLVEESPSPALKQVFAKNCANLGRAPDQSRRLHQCRDRRISGRSRAEFYLLEVNARIQVEHPVTEQVTGIDLIKEQIRIAVGEPLSFKQKEVRRPATRSSAGSTPRTPAQFRPLPGLITELRPPAARASGSTATPTPAIASPQLRQHDRQADRPPPHPRSGHCCHAKSTLRIPHRPDQNMDEQHSRYLHIVRRGQNRAVG